MILKKAIKVRDETRAVKPIFSGLFSYAVIRKLSNDLTLEDLLSQ